jgi:hypothetical protein
MSAFDTLRTLGRTNIITVLKRLTILLSLLLASSVANRPLVQNDASERCRAAAAYAEHILARHARFNIVTVFSSDDELLDDVQVARRWFREPVDDEQAAIAAPPRALLRALASSESLSAVRECAAVAALLRARGVNFGPEAVAAATNVSGDTYHASIEGFSLPVIDRAGATAVLKARGASGMLAGGSFLYLLRRNGAGAWVVYGSAPLSIS